MANIKELILSIEAPDASFDEKLAAITEMQATVEAMQAQEEQAINDNVDLIVEALRNIEAKVEAKLKEIPEKGDQGIQGPKGEQGDRGQDGAQGKDGLPGRDGKNGIDGKDGISVQDAKIDFDGSLVITLSDGREINVGEVVPVDVAQTIHKIQSGSGGDSQTTLNAIAALQATIATYGTMATQNANNVAITGGAINGTTIGATTASTGAFTTLSASSTVSGAGFSTYLASPPAIGGTAAAAGTFTTLIGGGGSANYWQATGGATNKSVQFQALGSDPSISQVFQPKGTGAIDLAAGSSGVNISNGGTVTAITRTNAGSGYTTIPNVVITAPTTAGGVQATASIGSMVTTGAAVVSGGTGYTLNDTITLVGGTNTGVAATFTVTGVSGGVITSASPLNYGQYSVLPTNPVSVTGGTGSGATFNINYGVGSNPAFTITNAGSGYVEQPTVSFSGGGGSGAAAYATVGSGTTVKTLGSTLSFSTPSSEVFRITDANPSVQNFLTLESSGGGSVFRSAGVSTNPSIGYVTKGTGNHYFSTNGSVGNIQFNVAHTASAVNYVQVTGSATNTAPQISSQGSDAAVGLTLLSKSASIIFQTRSAQGRSFNILDSASPVNYLQVQGNTATNAPILSAQGTDTDIDIAFTPKNAGVMRFGTYTASALLAVAGYITIKDSGGTTRRLLVG